MRGVILLVGLAFLYPVGAAAQTVECNVTLAWDPNSETDIASYRLSYGLLGGGPYTTQLTVPKDRTTLTIPIKEGTRQFFVVQATNIAGVTSGYSNEVNVLPACSGTGVIRIPARVTGATAVRVQGGT